MRFPLVRRSKMEAALESQLGLYNRLMGERDHEIARLNGVTEWLKGICEKQKWHENNAAAYKVAMEQREAELSRLREEKARLEMTLSDVEARRDEFFNVAFDRGQDLLSRAAELARLRAHFDATCKAKDEAYRKVMAERDEWIMANHRLATRCDGLAGRLDSLGLGDADWAHPTPRFSSVSVLADINGIRRVPVGLTACSVPDSSS